MAQEVIVVDIGGNRVLANAKTFSSGSTGYFASEKVVLDNARYQVTLSIVKIGSKPATDKKVRK